MTIKLNVSVNMSVFKAGVRALQLFLSGTGEQSMTSCITFHSNHVLMNNKSSVPNAVNFITES